MIHYVSGDIFSSGCDILVNPVNTVGVMGAGLALNFKSKYPGMFQRYFDDCRAGLLRVGEVKLYPVEHGKRFIANFPTKEHWGNSSKIEWIQDGLDDLREKLNGVAVSGKSIAFPKIGCGLGGLDWEDVKPLLVKTFSDYEPVVEIYE